MDNKEIIAKLERVDQLVSEVTAITSYCNEGYIDEAAEMIVDYESQLGELKRPAAFKIIPTFKLDEQGHKSMQEKIKLYLRITVVLAALMALLMVIFSYRVSNICTVLLFGAAFSGYLYVKQKKQYNEEKAKYDESVRKYEDTVPKFCSALNELVNNRDSYIESAKEYGIKLKETAQKCENAIDEVNEKRQAEYQKGLGFIEELKSYDFISEEYYHLAKKTASLLRSNRADTYKEALNLAIAEEKEEIREAERQAEETRRFQMMQEEARRQTEEIARHNREMERQQKAQDEAVLREQKRQNDNMLREQRQQALDAKRQAEKTAYEANRQQERTRLAGVSKCASCANSSKCPSSVKNNGSGLTCGGYRPYGVK